MAGELPNLWWGFVLLGIGLMRAQHLSAGRDGMCGLHSDGPQSGLEISW